ncbi:hypothetical protein M2432_004091 [Mycobacterium sp. OTB74]|nr:hypothetical protein [Mycobacterium sp. OTB74]
MPSSLDRRSASNRQSAKQSAMGYRPGTSHVRCSQITLAGGYDVIRSGAVAVLCSGIRSVMSNLWDPFSGVDVVNFVLRLCGWGERLAFELPQKRLDAVSATSRPGSADRRQPRASSRVCGRKMTRRLDRALDQRTAAVRLGSITTSWISWSPTRPAFSVRSPTMSLVGGQCSRLNPGKCASTLVARSIPTPRCRRC